MAERLSIVITGDGDDAERAIKAVRREVRGLGNDQKQSRRDTDQTSAAVNNLNRSLRQGAGAFVAYRAAVRGVQFSSIVASAGLAAQAINAVGAAAVGTTSALAPLSGLLATIPGGLAALGQGAGVATLALQDMDEALGGNKKALERLTPEAREFLRVLEGYEPVVKDIQRAAQGGLFGGVAEGLESAKGNADVVRKIAADTAVVLGRNTQRAGGILGTEAFGKDLALVGERNTRVIDRMMRSGINLAQALRDVTVAAGPLVNWLSLASLRFTELIEQEAAAGRASGDLARFFEDTRQTTERLASILQSTAAGMLAVGRAARPLGDDILEAIDDAADRWEQWTESIEGQREIRAWFDDAKPAIWETGRLLDDIVEAWLRMGADEGTAELIAQLRTKLLPVLEEILANTTEAFGPELIDALVAAGRLLGELSESGGPLVTLVDALANVAQSITFLLDKVPLLKEALTALAVGAGLYKAMQLSAALLGITRLIALTRALKVESAAVAAIGGLNVVAGGKPGKPGGKPGVGGAAAGVGGGAAVGALGGPWGAAAGAAVGAGVVFGPDIIKSITEGSGARGSKEARETFAQLTKGAGSYGAAVKAANAEMRRLDAGLKATAQGQDDWAGYGVKTGQNTEKLAAMRKELGRLKSDLKDAKLAQVGDAMERQFTQALAATKRTFSAIRDAVEINTERIASTLGKGSAEGKIAMARNFNLAAQSIRQAMDAGLISTKTGLEEIRKLMVAKLKEFGFSEEQAKNIREGQRYDGGANEGSASSAIKRAGGGWVGAPGERGRDEVPAMLGRGEAVLNHHQQRVVNAALAETGRGHLGKLFQHVRTPHYLASGGFAGVPGYATGGVVEAGRRLREQGYAVGEHPAFGGVAPVHTQNSYHYKGLAIDVNADNFPGGEGPALDKAAAWLRREYAGKILELLWRTAGHHDHLHAAIGGAGTGGSGGPGGMGAAGMTEAPEIRRVLADAKGLLGGVAQGALDTARAAAQERVNRAFAEAGGGLMGGTDEPEFKGGAGGKYDKEALAHLWRGAGGPSSLANLMAAIGLAESSGNPAANGPPDGRGLWQIEWPIWSKTLSKFGNPYDPAANARMALEVYRQQGLGAWVVYNTGAYRKFMESGGFVDPLFAAAGKPGRDDKTLGRTAPVAVGPAKGRRQPTTTTKKSGWKPKGLKFVGKLRHALPQMDQLHNLGVVIDALEGQHGRLADTFDLTDENATRTLPVASLTDAQLGSLGLSPDQIARLRAAEGQQVEVLNQGQFSDGRGITEHVAELTALIERKKQIGGFLGSKQMVADGLVQAIQAAIAERQERLRQIAERIKEVRSRVWENTKKIRGTQKALNDEERKKKPDRGRIRRLKAELGELRDERESLIGSRSVESGADEATPRSMLGIAYGYRESTQKGLDAYREELPGAQETAAGVPAELYEGVVSPIQRMSKEIGEWLNTAAPRIDIPESADDRSGTADEIARLKASLYDEAQKGRLTAEAQFGVFRGFAPMAAQRMLGSFARGIADVPHDGMAMLHAGETVVPNPNGPFQITARDMIGAGRAPQVTVVIEGDAAPLMRHVRTEIDGKVARVSEDLGRRQRLFTVAPGGR